jgi:endoplasmic reticulum-Golgi intermediate compartment protein 3
VESNENHQKALEKAKILMASLPEGYCGPCYGAHQDDDQCCNTCDDVLEAYAKKSWSNKNVLATAEQCIREKRDTTIADKPLKKGEGCNLSGYMIVNRVNGNFHVAMGQGMERDGRHIHSYKVDDASKFNVSHTIHELTFGPKAESVIPNKLKAKEKVEKAGNVHDVYKTPPPVSDQHQALNGVEKIVSKVHGATGTFQYFIKVVPTTYVYSQSGKLQSTIETNRYFFTERFRPLIKRYILVDPNGSDDDSVDENANGGKVEVPGGNAGSHSHKGHHEVRNSAVLPGVFFIYEIYPFAVEIHRNFVPFTHLLIRLMATIGGVFTIVGWIDAYLYSRERDRPRSPSRR